MKGPRKRAFFFAPPRREKLSSVYSDRRKRRFDAALQRIGQAPKYWLPSR
jgi:hypothetical protein